MKKYDVIVIGAGQAGPPLAVRFAKLGKKVAIIERKWFGGTCVNTGCIPSKTLIASAHVAHLAHEANEFGIKINGTVVADMKNIIKRKNDIVNKYAAGIEKFLTETKNCTIFKDQARFESATTIRVGDEIIQGEKIFINVGARALVPPMPGLEKIKFFTNSSMMDLDILPEHLIIVGGSYIGLEFAQMYKRFGSDVTIIEKAQRLISKEDPDVSAAIKNILEEEGIHIRLNAECIELDKENENVIVNLSCNDKEKSIVGSHLLLAIGRQPNTQDLGLDKAGVKMDSRGYIQVDDQLKTNVENIFALGECNGKGAFTHTSYNDYEIVASNLIDNIPRRVSDRILTYALFIDPPLGRAGLTETEALAQNKNVLVAKLPMTRVKRALIQGDAQGFMKVIVDKDTNLILGASILGVNGDEIIHSILDIMYAKAPYTVIKNAVHIHPTVSELIPTMLGEMTK